MHVSFLDTAKYFSSGLIVYRVPLLDLGWVDGKAWQMQEFLI
jgi:hypothetical protein